MKKSKILFSILTAVLFSGIVMILANCEGPEGPEGVAGKDGMDGIDGKDGVGFNSCQKCHELSDDLKARIIQYEASIHANGVNFERNGTDCAPCHVSQGFIERIAAGTNSTAAAISNPAPINCRTCHKIHTDYDSTDWELTTTSPVTLWSSGESVDFGKGNLCAQCHHARDYGDLSGDSFTVTSPYWGAHHGPQAEILGGTGGYEVAGSKTYYNSFHTDGIGDGCVTCHMAEPYGAQAGGHTWFMTYEYHGHEESNTAGCLISGCHMDEDALNTSISNKPEIIDSLLTQLSTLLQAKGVMDNTDHAIPGTYTSVVAGALMNYNMVREDRSNGVHNFKYAEALLTNSIEAIQ